MINCRCILGPGYSEVVLIGNQLLLITRESVERDLIDCGLRPASTCLREPNILDTAAAARQQQQPKYIRIQIYIPVFSLSLSLFLSSSLLMRSFY